MLGGVLALCAILGVSFLAEMPKHRFEADTRSAMAKQRGARLIQSIKSGDLASPVSWFWAATTHLGYAIPDPQMLNRFVTITFIYDYAGSPIVYLVDADCKARKLACYDLDQPESAFPARNIWGEPVVAPNGKTYRTVSISIPPDNQSIAALCNSDWSKERKASAAQALQRR